MLRKALFCGCLGAAAYQFLLLTATVTYRARKRRRKTETSFPPVSVLKAVHTVDDDTYRAFESQAAQAYPKFELLFGVRDERSEAAAAVFRLKRQFPAVDIRPVLTQAEAGNRKVGQLIDLAKQAKYPVWIVSDADIRVGPDYLSTIAAGLADPGVGVVTCPYVARGHSPAARWEAFGIGIDFVPSAMVANFIGVRDFALGATLAFRAADWQRAGGFERIRDHIADDYQVGHRLAALGKRSFLSETIVETSVGGGSWADVWQHQLRWARTIRLSKPWGFATLPITHAGLWMALAAVSRFTRLALALGLVRCLVAAIARWAQGVAPAKPVVLLAPAWDVYAFAVWSCSYFGRRVRWGDRVLQLRRDGTIRPQRGRPAKSGVS